MRFFRKAATPWGCDGEVGLELYCQLAGVCPPSVVPQYMVTVGLDPPVAVMFPLMVAVVAVTLDAELKVMVETSPVVVKFRDPAGQLVPTVLVALAVK